MTKSRYTSLLIVVLAALASASEPEPATAQVVLAVRGGASMATLAYKSAPGVEVGYRRGLAVGMSATYYPRENIGLRLGGAFVAKGAVARMGELENPLSINYVELSPMFDIRAMVGGGDREISLHLLAGPTVSLKRACESEFPGGGTTTRCKDLELDVETLDVGATVGAGLQFQLSRSSAVALSVEALYTLGLREVQDAGGRNPAKNRGFVAQTGVSIPVG